MLPATFELEVPSPTIIDERRALLIAGHAPAHPGPGHPPVGHPGATT